MPAYELPLFPLQTVLFPGGALPLHIFEERYRNMIRRCVEDDAPFGVVLIKEGREVGEPAIPHSVGTTARIVEADRMADGRMNILTRGDRRFRIGALLREQPHITALVEDIEDGETQAPKDLVSEVREAYADCVRALVALQGGWVADAKAPEDPVELSFFVPAAAEFEQVTRQEVIEIRDAAPRLARELAVLRRAKERLRRELGDRNVPSGPRLN